MNGVDPNVKYVCDTLERIATKFDTALIEAAKQIRWGMEGKRKRGNRVRRSEAESTNGR